jgi:6-phosphogluconolactonase
MTLELSRSDRCAPEAANLNGLLCLRLVFKGCLGERRLTPLRLTRQQHTDECKTFFLAESWTDLALDLAPTGLGPGVTMKLGNCGRLLLGFTFFLAGCGNFWAPPSSSSSSGNSSTTLSSGFFYVINQGTSQIVAYDINSGALSQIGAYTMANAPIAIAMAPNGASLYVSTLAGIYLYTVGSNGGLTIGFNGQVVSQDPAQALAVDTTSGWLVDAVQGNNQVILDATALNTNGTPSGNAQTQVYTVNNAVVSQLAISSDDDHVFLAAGTGGTVVTAFTSANSKPLATSGQIIGVANTGGSALTVAVDPTLRVFYIGEVLGSGGTTGGLRVFNYSSLSGTLSQATGSPIASGGLSPHAILPPASSDYVYVANGTGATTAGNITGFSLSGTSGAYTIAKANTVSTGILPYGLAQDSTGNFVMAVSSSGDPDLQAFVFDTTTAGQLDSVITSTTGTDPTKAIGIVATP